MQGLARTKFVFFSEDIYVFRTILRIEIDYFPDQYQQTGLCCGGVLSFLWDRKWIFFHEFQASKI
jgi:hypothetical protein